MRANPINEKQEGDSPYIAGLNGKTIGFYAAGLWPAKQFATNHFKPKKKEAGLLWVELAEEE
ncbi:MAG: hypothetical protein [Bacteriophage sp.]|nr:MAG: hypothetical protein [Bacteriophage sp.]